MKKVPDPRSGRKKKHDIASMLTYLIMAYISGRCSLRRAQKWAERNKKMLKKHLHIKGGIASVSTLHRLLAQIDEEEFVQVFAQWASEILKLKGINIIIDGKGLRGGTERLKNGKTPYILNAIDMTTKLVISQLAIENKKNEISAIPLLLENLETEGNTIFMDAIGTQTSIMEQILRSRGHYFLVVKKNNLSVYEEILGFFRMIEAQLKNDGERDENTYRRVRDILEHYSKFSREEKNRERLECRETKTYNGGTIQSREEEVFDSVRCIGQICNVRIPVELEEDGSNITRDKDTFLKKGSVRNPKIRNGDGFGDDIETYGIIADFEMTAERMGDLNRQRWSIENQLHHVLDDAFREDRSPAKKCRNNLALIRKLAYNILRIAIIQSGEECGIIDKMDEFNDDWSLFERYIFSGITPIS